MYIQLHERMKEKRERENQKRNERISDTVSEKRIGVKGTDIGILKNG